MNSYFDTDWSLMDFGDKKAEAVKAVPANSCPKCGRPLGKGAHLHIKACKANDSARNPR